MPANIKLPSLRPYSPELDGRKNVFGYIRQEYLSNRVFRDVDHLSDETRTARLSLASGRLVSLTRPEWTDRAATS